MSQTKTQLIDSAYESGAVLTGSTNNTIPTVTGANAIAGEATLTYDGAGQLSITGNSAGDGLSITNDGNHYTMLSMDADRTSASNALGILQGKWNNNSVCSIYLRSGADTSNKDDGEIAFNTSAASSSEATRMIIKNNGNVEISDGDLVIGTAGHGIDFSANSHAGGKASELLDHYEEGTWSPTFANLANAVLNTNTNGEYIRIGNLVYIRCWVGLSSITGGQSWLLDVGGLPYAANSGSYGRYALAINAYGLSFGSDRQAIYAAMNESGTSAQIMSTDGTNPNVSASQVTANNCTGSTSFYITGSYHVLGY